MSDFQWQDKVSVFEVGPRDGLQNIETFIPTDRKVELIDRLTNAGCRRIEVSSFVHPAWVPQLRDAVEVFERISRKAGVTYSALIPNLKGLERALASDVDEVVTILSASQSHNRSNLNRSVEASLEETGQVIAFAKEHDVPVRSYIATSFGCPFEGRVSAERVAQIAHALEEFGCYEVSLGDTTGMADPRLVYDVAQCVLRSLSGASLAIHLHQCGGIEFANVLAALHAGVCIFDGAAGGLGGCPYAPGASGNIATERLVTMLSRMGMETGIDVDEITACGRFAQGLTGDARAITSLRPQSSL